MSKKLLIANNVFMNVGEPCPLCGNLEKNCTCSTLEQLDLTDIEVDFSIAFRYSGISSLTSNSSTTKTVNGYTFRNIVSSDRDSTQENKFKTKMTELGRKSGTDYSTSKSSNLSSAGYFIFWNETLYGSPRTRFTNLVTTTFTEELLNQLNTYGKFDTSNVTSMNSMFRYCKDLTSLNASNWNTSNVTSMNSMFYDCTNLTSLNISKWNTSNVTDMRNMFYGCTSLTTLDLSNWNVGNVTYTTSMFYNCTNLTNLDMSNWNTEKLTSMNYMFQNCTNLTNLDMSNCDISKVTGTTNMFQNCTSLTNFKAPQNINYNIDFSFCTNLTHDSLMSIINNLATTTSSKTLTLGEINKAKLTDEEKAIAKNKGWTIMPKDIYTYVIDYNQSVEPTLPSFATLTKQSSNASYGFEHQAYDGGGYGLLSQNKGVGNSNAHGQIAIDTSGMTGTIKVKVTYNISSESSAYDYLRLFLTTSSTCTYSESGYFGSGGGTSYQTTNTYSTSSEKSCGSIYYLHFFYRKDSGGNKGYDRFCIKQIEITHTA